MNSVVEMNKLTWLNNEYLDPERPETVMTKTQNESLFDVETITFSPYVTEKITYLQYVIDKDNCKELNDIVKRFVIENGHFKPKGLFLKDSDKRSFLENIWFLSLAQN